MKEVFLKESTKPQRKRKIHTLRQTFYVIQTREALSFLWTLAIKRWAARSLLLSHIPYIHTHTLQYCLFEFLRNSFYFSGSSLWVTVQNLPLKVWKKRGIVWFMLEMNSIKILLLRDLIGQKMGFQMLTLQSLLLRADLERQTSKGCAAFSLEFYNFPRTHHNQWFSYWGHCFA